VTNLLSFTATSIDGSPISLDQYATNVVLIVNTASKCAFTSQFEGLQKLHDTYRKSGFVVLGFPCNQFMNQEPGSNTEILDFCSTKFDVSFPMFSKVDVNGSNAHPLYAWLKEKAPGIGGSTGVKWNFTKFLLDRSGMPVVRYAPTMQPQNIAPTIERLLKK
jgi:glutathione peroxidase